MTKPPAAERARLTLEEYILFFTTHSGKGLTIDLLNQILFMHGFTKLCKSNKTVLVDALNSLDLLRPRRSTVSINASAAAELSKEDVRRDIEELGWGACRVGSVLSIRAGAGTGTGPVPLATMPPGSAAVQRVSPTSVLGASPLMSPPAAPGLWGKRKQRTPRGSGRDANAPTSVLGASSLMSPPAAPGVWGKRKQRTPRGSGRDANAITLPSIDVQDISAAA